MRIGAVIVAAGWFEKDTDAACFMEMGELAMAERVVLNFQRAGVKEIVMVTGFQGKELEKRLKHYRITFLRNEAYEQTQMFDSAKLGLTYMKDRCDRLLFCPADVPFFTETTVKLLLKEKGSFVVPVFREQQGHPICMDAGVVAGVLDYQGNGGLRGALDELHVKPMEVQIEDEGAVTDAYRNKNYEHLVERHDAGLLRPQVKVKLANKKPFFNGELVNLLKLIDSFGSVKDACDRAGISYSKGFSVIHLAEKELGYEIVERQQGGKFGGQAAISKRGVELIKKFELFEAQITEEAEELYKQIFGSSQP